MPISHMHVGAEAKRTIIDDRGMSVMRTISLYLSSLSATFALMSVFIDPAQTSMTDMPKGDNSIWRVSQRL